MDPKQPKSYRHTVLLSYICQLIDLSQGWEIFIQFQVLGFFTEDLLKTRERFLKSFEVLKKMTIPQCLKCVS